MAGNENDPVMKAMRTEAATVLADMHPAEGDPDPRTYQVAAQMLGHGYVEAGRAVPPVDTPRAAAQLAMMVSRG